MPLGHFVGVFWGTLNLLCALLARHTAVAYMDVWEISGRARISNGFES